MPLINFGVGHLSPQIRISVIIGDVYDFMIFSERIKLIEECVEEKHKIIDVPLFTFLQHIMNY